MTNSVMQHERLETLDFILIDWHSYIGYTVYSRALQTILTF